MAALTFPAGLRFANAQFRLRANTQSFVSPLNGAVQTLELPGAVWGATYEVVPMTADQAAEVQAFLVALMGRSGRFLAFDPARTRPRGAFDDVLDAPLVMGAGQSGATLATDGWRASITGLLLPGDYVGLVEGGQAALHMITAAVDSDASGQATLAFKPPLRASPADDAPLTLVDPTVEMMLDDDDQATWRGLPAGLVDSITFSGTEAF